ncbi:hypothetical protein Pelo_4347 [Pelomyxa schiedti]|nr:hypothetical protein Pelo_4347 [Pelomyxa schiedti]
MLHMSADKLATSSSTPSRSSPPNRYISTCVDGKWLWALSSRLTVRDQINAFLVAAQPSARPTPFPHGTGQVVLLKDVWSRIDIRTILIEVLKEIVQQRGIPDIFTMTPQGFDDARPLNIDLRINPITSGLNSVQLRIAPPGEKVIAVLSDEFYMAKKLRMPVVQERPEWSIVLRTHDGTLERNFINTEAGDSIWANEQLVVLINGPRKTLDVWTVSAGRPSLNPALRTSLVHLGVTPNLAVTKGNLVGTVLLLRCQATGVDFVIPIHLVTHQAELRPCAAEPFNMLPYSGTEKVDGRILNKRRVNRPTPPAVAALLNPPVISTSEYKFINKTLGAITADGKTAVRMRDNYSAGFHLREACSWGASIKATPLNNQIIQCSNNFLAIPTVDLYTGAILSKHAAKWDVVEPVALFGIALKTPVMESPTFVQQAVAEILPEPQAAAKVGDSKAGKKRKQENKIPKPMKIPKPFYSMKLVANGPETKGAALQVLDIASLRLRELPATTRGTALGTTIPLPLIPLEPKYEKRATDTPQSPAEKRPRFSNTPQQQAPSGKKHT